MPLYNYEVDGERIDSFYSAGQLSPRDRLVLAKRFSETKGVSFKGVRITGGTVRTDLFEPGFH